MSTMKVKNPAATVYFSLYFAMTGMHALHMIIGIVLLFWLLIRAQQGAYTSGYVQPDTP